jgi:TetR/AcrR family transcriptional regulator
MATRPGERRVQILHTLAEMLQDPKAEKITTAALAARLEVSEAALYRHFASKAQMFEGLIEFIEQTIFGLTNKIVAEEENGMSQLHGVVAMLLGFAEKNPGMTRVLIGDALVNEDERLQARINQLHDRIEATLKQCLRLAATQAPTQDQAAPPPADGADPAPHANLILAYVVGRWHQFAKSGFRRKPTDLAERQWALLA